jgi:hypothetical protein
VINIPARVDIVVCDIKKRKYRLDKIQEVPENFDESEEIKKVLQKKNFARVQITVQEKIT